AVEDVARPADHFAEVVEGELARHLVDAHHTRLAAPVVRLQGFDHLGARGRLLQRRAGILQVEEHLVGRAARGLLHHARVTAGDGKNRPAKTCLHLSYLVLERAHDAGRSGSGRGFEGLSSGGISRSCAVDASSPPKMLPNMRCTFSAPPRSSCTRSNSRAINSWS